MSDSRIHLSAPDVRGRERELVLAAIDSNWLAPAGPDLDEFEHSLAAATGRKYAVALSSGTAALHLALLVAGVKPGDAVLCSSLTFAGSANPIVYCGATPVFIDSEDVTWNMDPELLDFELRERASAGTLPTAAVVVDLYGNCADYKRIMPLLERYNIPMIEDAAEALGATSGQARAGSLGDSAILSFNGNKIITSSGGGAFVTDQEAAADRVRFLSTQAREPALHYEHSEIGFNYRMSNICAALGRAQLETLDQRIARRRQINAAYLDCFANIEGVTRPVSLAGSLSNHWLTCLRFDEARIERDALIDALAACNIESRPVWKPMHSQPVFASAPSRTNGTAERLFREGICLPSGSGMSDAEMDRILSCIRNVLVP